MFLLNRVMGLGINLILTLFFLGSTLGQSVFAYAFHWKQIESEHYRLYYPESLSVKAMSVLQKLEMQHAYVVSKIGYDYQKLTVRLEDPGLMINSFVELYPKRFTLWLQSPDSTSMLNDAEFENSIIAHELTHASHLMRPLGQFSLYSILAPTIYMNSYSPTWLVEGLATYVESEMNKYSGRLNQPDFATLIYRQSISGNLPGLNEFSSPMYRYPLGRSSYLYGSHFMYFLAQNFGEEKFNQFFDLMAKNLWAPFGLIFPNIGIDSIFHQVYGRSLHSLYYYWIGSIRDHQEEYFLTGEKVTDSGWYKPGMTSDGQSLFYYHSEIQHSAPHQLNARNKIMKYDPKTKSNRVIYETGSQILPIFKVRHDKIYFLVSEIQYGFANFSMDGWGFVRELKSLDLISGEEKFIESGMIRCFDVFSGKTYFATSEYAQYRSMLWQIEDGQKKQLFEVPILISEMVIESDEKAWLVARHENESWNLYQLNIKTEKLEAVLTSPWPITNIYLSEKGLVFHHHEKDELSTLRFNEASKSVLKLSLDIYSKDGWVIGDRFYFVSIHSDGEDIFSHEVVEKEVAWVNQTRPIAAEIKKHEIKSGKAEDALFKSVQSMFNPHSVFLPKLLAGQDDLGLFSWQLEYDFSVLSFGLSTRLFQPLNVSARFNRFSQNYLFQLPLYRRMQYGLRNLSMFLNQFVFLDPDDDDTSVTNVGFQADFGFPAWNVQNRYTIDFRNHGFLIESSPSYFREKYRFSGSLQYYQDFVVFKNLRAQNVELIQDDGGVFFKGYFTHHLYDVDRGNWLPNIWVGKIYGTIFGEYLKLSDRSFRSIGAELNMEAFVGMNIPIVFSYGYAFINDSPVPVVYTDISISLSF